jgi:hypothetical protein
MRMQAQKLVSTARVCLAFLSNSLTSTLLMTQLLTSHPSNRMVSGPSSTNAKDLISTTATGPAALVE